MMRRAGTRVIKSAVAVSLVTVVVVGAIVVASPSKAQSASGEAANGWQTNTAAAIATPLLLPALPKAGDQSRQARPAAAAPRKAHATRPRRPQDAAPQTKLILPTDAESQDAHPRIPDAAAVPAAQPARADCVLPAMVAKPAPVSAPSPAYTSAVQRFCASIGPTAIEARFAWQRRTIAELEKEIAVRIERLDAKIEEHKKWLAKREAFAAKATTSLVLLITKMKAEAAALQLAEMEEDVAAALLMRLDAKISGPLLGEIPPIKAARLAGLIAASADVSTRPTAAKAASVAASAPVKEGGN
jgi:flagellar motility protein MotE (MotC chaperone)